MIIGAALWSQRLRPVLGSTLMMLVLAAVLDNYALLCGQQEGP